MLEECLLVIKWARLYLMPIKYCESALAVYCIYDLYFSKTFWDIHIKDTTFSFKIHKLSHTGTQSVHKKIGPYLLLYVIDSCVFILNRGKAMISTETTVLHDIDIDRNFVFS
jgi:hypothetical protein